jgi:hypothetical protein
VRFRRRCRSATRRDYRSGSGGTASNPPGSPQGAPNADEPISRELLGCRRRARGIRSGETDPTSNTPFLNLGNLEGRRGSSRPQDQAAAHATAQILAEAHNARLLLAGDYSTTNALGVLEQPEGYLAEMKVAREAIDCAIAIRVATNWPSASDYHAL